MTNNRISIAGNESVVANALIKSEAGVRGEAGAAIDVSFSIDANSLGVTPDPNATQQNPNVTQQHPSATADPNAPVRHICDFAYEVADQSPVVAKRVKGAHTL